LEVSGRPTSADIAQAEDDIRASVVRLRVPFDVISDVRALESLEEVTMADAQRVGTLLSKAKVRRVIRVVGRSSAAAIHMERLARALGHSAHLAYSREEAESLITQRP
jgi:hypothetical protein